MKQLEQCKKQDLAIAAKELQEDYQVDPELTAFTSLDGEDFDLCRSAHYSRARIG